MKEWLIRAQQPRSKHISCKGQRALRVHERIRFPTFFYIHIISCGQLEGRAPNNTNISADISLVGSTPF